MYLNSAYKWLSRSLVAATLIAATIASAQATQIDGSFTVAPDQASVNGSSLATSTVFTPIIPGFYGGIGDFSGLSDGMDITSSVLDLNDLTSYTFSGVGIGTWTTTAGSYAFIGTNILGVVLEGVFTPDFGGYDPTPAVQVISLTQAGRSYSWSATVNTIPDSTPSEVPEPLDAALVAGGLVGIGLLRRKHSKA